MYKISIDKELFDDILLKKTNLLTKENTKYWKKELLDTKIVNDKISYSIKQFDKIMVTNGFGEDKPSLIAQCQKVEYSSYYDRFEFTLGKILEQKNTNLDKDYKDTLIANLLKEKEMLEDKMNRDILTGLYNRRKMEEDLEAFVNQNNSFLLTAIFIDADRFKGINDNFGHKAGDDALIYLSKKLKTHSKYLNGEAYRYGGEEFLILCFIAKDRVISKLNDLREDIKSEPIFHPKKDIFITVSIGVSFFSECSNKEELLIKADKGVYKAKNDGRDRIEII